MYEEKNAFRSHIKGHLDHVFYIYILDNIFKINFSQQKKVWKVLATIKVKGIAAIDI